MEFRTLKLLENLVKVQKHIVFPLALLFKISEKSDSDSLIVQRYLIKIFKIVMCHA